MLDALVIHDQWVLTAVVPPALVMMASRYPKHLNSQVPSSTLFSPQCHKNKSALPVIFMAWLSFTTNSIQ